MHINLDAYFVFINNNVNLNEFWAVKLYLRLNTSDIYAS